MNFVFKTFKNDHESRAARFGSDGLTHNYLIPLHLNTYSKTLMAFD